MDSYFQFEHADGLYFVLTFIIVLQFCDFFIEKKMTRILFQKPLKARTIKLFKVVKLPSKAESVHASHSSEDVHVSFPCWKDLVTPWIAAYAVYKDICIPMHFGVLSSHYLHVWELWEENKTLRKQDHRRCMWMPHRRNRGVIQTLKVIVLTTEPLCGPGEVSLTSNVFD